MLEMKCDNKDGTINWKNRATIAVVVHRLCGGKKQALLEQLKEEPKFQKMVSDEWDEIETRGKSKAKRKTVSRKKK